MFNHAVLILAASLALGADNRAQQANLKDFEPFLGAWEVTEFEYEGDTHQIHLTWTPILDGRFIEGRWVSINNDGDVASAGLDIIGIDPSDQKAKFWEFDLEGGVTQLVFAGRDGQKSVWDVSSVQADGNRRKAKVTFQSIDRNSYEWSIRYADGEQHEAIFRRSRQKNDPWPQPQGDMPDGVSGPMKELAWWVGEFAYEGSRPFSDSRFQGRSRCQWILGGNFMLYQAAVIDNDLAASSYCAVIGVDPANGKTTGWEFDSSGSVGRYDITDQGKGIAGQGIAPDVGSFKYQGRIAQIENGLVYKAVASLPDNKELPYAWTWRKDGSQAAAPMKKKIKDKPKDVLAAQSSRKDFAEYCRLMEGRWIGEVTWVADWPGFGNKGDKVTCYFEATVTEDGNTMTMRFLGGTGSATGLCYYDAGAKEIKFVWVHSSGLVTHNNAFKDNGKWIETGGGTLPDSRKTSFRSTLTISDGGNTMTVIGGGTLGDERTDPQRDVWRRVSVSSSVGTIDRQGKSADMPKKAREALNMFVGDWESQSFNGDEKIGSSVDRRSWGPGKHCLLLDWSGVHDGAPWRASGIAGWDAKSNAIIEYWHGSQGQSLVVCYPLDKMSPKGWEGTSCFTTADGVSTEGPCRLTRTAEGFQYEAPAKRDGNETVFRSVARRLKEHESAAEATKPAKAEPQDIPQKALAAMEYFLGAWEGEDLSAGQSLGKNLVRRSWAPGKHSLRIEWTGEHDGTPGGPDSRFSGLAGWDPKSQAVVEHWFGSRGQVLTNSYPIAEMKGDTWHGTFSFVTPEGTYVEGKSEFTSDPKEGVWVGRSIQDGKEVVYKSVARRVKQ